VIVIAGKPQEAVHAGGDHRQSPCGAFWETVCETVSPMLSDRCPVLSCLSVTLVYCGQTVGWIKMKFGMQVCLGPGHIGLDGGPSSLPPTRQSPLPNFRPISVVAKWLAGLRCHLVSWYGGRPQLKRLCVRWRPSSPPQKGGGAPSKFSAHVHCGQTAGWITTALGMEMGLGPGHIVLSGDPAPLPKKGA